jgi:repressor LexA
MKLTKRQKEILDFITEFIDREGYSPSMEEIAERFQIASLNAIFKHLEALAARGFLRRDPNRARAIELSHSKQSGSHSLPLYGYVAAGRPIEAVASPESLTVPEDFLSGRGPHFVLRVQGESMIEEHIADGDYVVVESRVDAQNGEMVVALVDGDSATLKRFFHEGDRIRLQPANQNLAPIILEPGRVKVQGIVVGVMRKYR